MMRLVVAVAAVSLSVCPATSAQQPTYYAYVASESADEVSLVGFRAGRGAWVEKTIPVGFWPAEMEGPHGLYVAPDGAHWYLTLGHGLPLYGQLLKYRTGVDTLEARAELGLFPATVVVSPGGLVFAVNANFHGEHVPSTVSVVDAASMIEIDRIETCTMPHGSRLGTGGVAHYSGCMMDDELVEIDVSTLEVSRRLRLGPGMHATHSESGESPCSPTWAAPSPDGRYVYVPCNKRDEVLEVDLDTWRITRSFASPRAPYNAEVTPDGRRVIVTQRGSAQVSVWDVTSGKRVALLPSTRGVTHGVTVTPDGRYAFISVEGVGGQPGAVDVIDLGVLERVGSVDVGKQAGGIFFWKMERS